MNESSTSGSNPVVDFRDVVGPVFTRRIARQTQFEKRVARELGTREGSRSGFRRGLFWGGVAGFTVCSALLLAWIHFGK